MVGAEWDGAGAAITSYKLTTGQHITRYPSLPTYHKPQGTQITHTKLIPLHNQSTTSILQSINVHIPVDNMK